MPFGAPPGSGELLRARALVIDDSDLARSFVAGLLSSAGLDVLTLASAIGATRTIVRNQVDVAVVDVSMPGLNGDKLVGVLRSNSRIASLIIIIISAKPEEELSKIASETTADAVLSKDVLEKELVPLVRSLLKTRQSENPIVPFALAGQGAHQGR